MYVLHIIAEPPPEQLFGLSLLKVKKPENAKESLGPSQVSCKQAISKFNSEFPSSANLP